MSIDSRDLPPPPESPEPPEPVERVEEADESPEARDEHDELDNVKQPFDSLGRPTDIEGPAGKWEVPSARERGQEYENWCREKTDAPPGMEYTVENENGKRELDTRYVEDRDGEPTEVLVDAKDAYDQFIDSKTGDWEAYWKYSEKGGLPKAMEQAHGQVKVAEGRPVEWWCAEPGSAELFQEAFEDDDDLKGKIRAIHKPMDERDG